MCILKIKTNEHTKIENHLNATLVFCEQITPIWQLKTRLLIGPAHLGSPCSVG